MVRRRGHPVQIVKGAHESADARANCCFEWRKVDGTQRIFRHVGGVVIAPAFRGPVGDPVLCTRENFAREAVIMALKAQHPSTRKLTAEAWIFAGAFGDAPPARIPRDV